MPFAPAAVTGSDDRIHLAYELHVTSIYDDAGPLTPRELEVYADDDRTPLARFDAEDLAGMTRPAPAEHAPVTIDAGKRVVYVWLTLPTASPLPRTLRHRMTFATAKQKTELLDGVRVSLSAEAPVLIGPPLRGGLWLAHEGPGNAHSHHWGSLVAVNGQVTIPQRYALDLVGIDPRGQVVRAGVKNVGKSRHADWVGYGADVLAVADGVVRDARDGEPEHPPLNPQSEPESLTAHGLFGNYVVLEIQPGVFASYAHLQRGSVKLRIGDHVRKGQLLARLDQSGSSSAPHLHFQLSSAMTFEGSEGLPFLFDRFDLLGPEAEAQLFGQGEPWVPLPLRHRQAEMPLDDMVIGFPALR
ncbi:M23 family metallopeptidase [Rhodanobacter sp. Root561]|uniref:M23 family metallopeptidase n=1 Tax=Rhodanobacter sp. Root561 TaxID=1736560 RepID=UPI00138EE622|nr:M23 family metallopeptidase [Rhodanobacter sp. Root561]